VDAQVRLYPEEIIAYDTASAQQSQGQLYRATIINAVSDLSTGLGILSKSVADLQSAQRANADRLDSVVHTVDQLGERQGDVLAAVQEAVAHLQAIANPPQRAANASAAAVAYPLTPRSRPSYMELGAHQQQRTSSLAPIPRRISSSLPHRTPAVPSLLARAL
jgi:hypothetical protein